VEVRKDRISTSGGAATSAAGVFAAGDAVTGPDNIIGAVAGG
jgi:NADPH-dependent glutamate synthase beta subunit-like oxidoreductase